ncbi:hypothetical protein [Ornithinimicrobium faecis]|uniref:hypothetical protein n=1 Tax=Ornithinimicrobium faecis TaxID=2934158 RepID=UPI00211754B8|nr:hypothetical protein [Ornithinimicrobium sp. HY1745]
MSRAAGPARGRTTRRSATVLVATLVAFATPIAAASADPVLETADAEVELAADGTATVQLTYHILADADGEPVDSLSFSYLDFGGAQPQNLLVTGPDGTELPHESQTTKAETNTTVTLAEPLAPGQPGTFEVSYAVPAADAPEGNELSSNIPMVTLDQPAATAAPETFTATLQLPAEHTLVEGFPANPAVDTTTDGSEVLHYQVPALTSVLRVVSTSGQPTFWTTETQMEAALVLTIVVGIGLLYVSFVRPQRKAAQARGTTVTASQN